MESLNDTGDMEDLPASSATIVNPIALALIDASELTSNVGLSGSTLWLEWSRVSHSFWFLPESCFRLLVGLGSFAHLLLFIGHFATLANFVTGIYNYRSQL